MAAESRGARAGLLNQVCTSAALDAALDEMDKEYELQRRHLNYSFDDTSSSDIESFVSALDVCLQDFCFYTGWCRKDRDIANNLPIAVWDAQWFSIFFLLLDLVEVIFRDTTMWPHLSHHNFSILLRYLMKYLALFD